MISRFPLLSIPLVISACSSPQGTEILEFNEPTFMVNPGVEKTQCVHMQAPSHVPDGELFVSAFSSELPEGTHHFFMSYDPRAKSELGLCEDVEEGGLGQDLHGGGDRGKFLFGGGVGLYETSFPEGYALHLPNSRGHFIADHHALNLGQEPIEMWGNFTMTVEPASDVPHPLTSFACVNSRVNIAPHSDAIVTGTCTVPHDVDLMVLSSHGHQYLKKFETRIFDGSQTLDDVIYTSTTWDSPKVMVLDAPISLQAGQGLTFSCHYTNSTDQVVTWGAGEFSEMCATINAYAFPPSKAYEIPPTIGSAIGDEMLCGLLGPRCCEEDICQALDTTYIDSVF